MSGRPWQPKTPCTCKRHGVQRDNCPACEGERKAREAMASNPVCPNCGQWQHAGNGGDCLNECKRRGFA